MADIDLQGRRPEDIPEPREDKDAKVTNVIERTPLPESEQRLTQSSPMVELRPTAHVHGNEMVVLIQILSSINRNLAFLSRTIFEHLNPDKKESGS